jgi:hypothetical protein
MAHTIESFPRRRRGRPPMYDWDALFDGQIHVWYQGEDFKTSPVSFRALVHRTAATRSEDGPWKAETRIQSASADRPAAVLFKFYNPES